MSDQDDETTSLMDDIDPRFLELIQNRLNSFIKWDLVVFFHRNPHTTDTADNIARYTGRDVRIVEPELIALAHDGVLEMEALGELRVFWLVNNPEVRVLVAQFIAACDDRQFRVKAIYHIIRCLH